MKAAAGLLYDANYDAELIKERETCSELLYDYNMLRPSMEAEREKLLRRILGGAGKSVTILSPFRCDYGYNIFAGENFFMNAGGVILDGARVSFGDNVFIGPCCGFHTAGHPLDIAQRNAGLEYARPITVGDNVWIGAQVCVLPGVSIGSGSVIGAGSVVTRDIPENVVAAGNPCRVIRRIMAEDKDPE